MIGLKLIRGDVVNDLDKRRAVSTENPLPHQRKGILSAIGRDAAAQVDGRRPGQLFELEPEPAKMGHANSPYGHKLSLVEFGKYLDPKTYSHGTETLHFAPAKFIANVDVTRKMKD